MGTTSGEVVEVTWDQAMRVWERELRYQDRSRETIRTWRSYLRRWGRWCAANGVDPVRARTGDVKDWIALHGHWSRQSHKSARMALGSMYRALAAEGVIKAKRNPMRGIDAVRVLRQPQKVASERQVARGARSRDADTALMVAVLATTGARCAEAAGLRREDVDADGAGITVLGKGGKRRWVPVQDARVGRALLARPSGYVWPGRFGGHVHEATLRRKVRESTGVPPHALRRRFASQAYDGTGDLLALQMLLGHSSPATTELYVRLDRKRLRAAGDAAALPDAA